MNYSWLTVEDEPYVNWVIFRADPNRRLCERYKTLACSSCGRVDELEALSRGFDDATHIRSKFDCFTSDDGFKCVSKRGRNIIEESGATGLEFLSLPGGEYFVVVATHRIPVKRKVLETREEETLDLDAIARDPRLISSARKTVCIESDSCGMEFHGGKCGGCGRYFQTLYWPKLSSMTLPGDPSLIVTPDVLFENMWSSETWLLASDALVDKLQRAGLRGLDPMEAA